MLNAIVRNNKNRCKLFDTFYLLGTEQGIVSLQNQLQARENELNKEKKIRKQLEQQFEKSTEKRLIKELLPNRSTNAS